ncbi:MAG: hypothetical protein Greene101449_191 [Candidatus Peregrinibacteria bacterium Greene1014_49]|nr:MAG: hypothetical protein Greene101449_191 [Candidatus Peregrinibacteria bacterium Greene1014_49]
MHIPHLFHRHSTSIQEHRLCAWDPEHLGTGSESLTNAQEVVGSFALLERNAAIKKAMALYDDPLVRGRFAELTSNSLDRPYVLTLLLDGMVRNKDGKPIEKGKFGFTDIPGYTADPVDPFGIYAKYKDTPAELGTFLKSFVSPEVLLQIDTKGENAEPTDLGKSYIAVIERGLVKKDADPYPSTVFVDVNLLWYQHIRKKLQGSMDQRGVSRPDLTKEFLGDDKAKPRPKLTKVQYLGLLRKGIQKNDLPTFASSETILLAGQAEADTLPKNTGNLFTTMTIGKYGPQESLRRLDIHVGDFALSKYLDKRSGIQRDEKTGAIIPGARTKELIGSATEWRGDPKAAFEFLFGNPDGAMSVSDEEGTSNRVFRDSLEYWFVPDPAGKLPRGAKPDKLMSKEDTNAVLYLVVQQFLAYEDPRKKTNDQREELKKEVTLTQNLEGFMGKAWKYMKDFEKHPLGSAFMWLSAFHAVRILLGTLKGKPKMWQLGLLGGAAIGLYQQDSKGRAWWNDLTDKVTGAITKDQALNPKDRTLPNYWLRELKKVEGEPGEYNNLTEDKEQLMLALSGTVPIQDMLGWYRKYQAFTLHRDGNTMPPIPFQYSKFRNRLGSDAGPKHVGDYLYKTLHKFFVHRGQAVQQEHIPFGIPGGFSEKEGLGFAYIKDKYIEHRYYIRLIEQLGIPKDLKLTEPEIQMLKNGVPMTAEEIAANPKLQAEMVRLEGIAQPERDRHISALLYLIRLFEMEGISDNSSTYSMDHVYFMESNTEVLSRMQSEGALPAGAWEEFLAWYRGGNKPVKGVATGSPASRSTGSTYGDSGTGSTTRGEGGSGTPERSPTGSTTETSTGDASKGLTADTTKGTTAGTTNDGTGSPESRTASAAEVGSTGSAEKGSVKAATRGPSGVPADRLSPTGPERPLASPAAPSVTGPGEGGVSAARSGAAGSTVETPVTAPGSTSTGTSSKTETSGPSDRGSSSGNKPLGSPAGGAAGGVSEGESSAPAKDGTSGPGSKEVSPAASPDVSGTVGGSASPNPKETVAPSSKSTGPSGSREVMPSTREPVSIGEKGTGGTDTPSTGSVEAGDSTAPGSKDVSPATKDGVSSRLRETGGTGNKSAASVESSEVAPGARGNSSSSGSTDTGNVDKGSTGKVDTKETSDASRDSSGRTKRRGARSSGSKATGSPGSSGVSGVEK